MIIFALEGVLADDDHRKHLIYPNHSHGFEDLYHSKLFFEKIKPDVSRIWYEWIHKFNGTIWKPDYKAYYDACDEDSRIKETVNLLNAIFRCYLWDKQKPEIEIWSGRCESVKQKTETWLYRNAIPGIELKMRPTGDTRPEWELKEEWIDSFFSYPEFNCPLRWAQHDKCCKKIEMVFEADPESIAMFRRKGIFVFDCRQEKE